MQEDRQKLRQSYATRCGVAGICLNLVLFAGKLLAGALSHSIAIMADAFNNLSDAGSSVISLIGFRLAGAKPDPEHPFGHGRMEYVAGLVVSGAILLMAYELIRDSIQKIRYPVETEFSVLIAGILVASILVKLFMAYYNGHIGKKIDSAALRATAIDSLSDTCATLVVLLSMIVGHATGWQIDGWCGVLVGLFILYAGIGAVRETLDPLLGQAPDEEFVEQIHQIVMAHEGICGIHDLIVHDYGPGRQIISMHAEVAAEGDILEIHDVIDNAENELRAKLGCDATIHMDPIVTADEHVGELKLAVNDIVTGIDEVLTTHDFRVVTGPTHTNLIFDVLVPYRFYISDDELTLMIQERVKERLGRNHFVVMHIDRAYVKG